MNLLIPPDGLSLQSSADPAGNNQESAQIVYRDPATGIVHGSGLYLQVHAGQKIRGYVTPSAGTSAAFFETDSETSKIVIEQS